MALDGVTDVRNIGAIARSAECFGATALVIPSFGVAPIQEDAIKSSSGALLRLPVARVPDMARALEGIQAQGMTCIALDEKAEKSIHAHHAVGPVCLVMGDEGMGISEGVARNCALQLRLPMTGKTGSLNVSSPQASHYLILPCGKKPNELLKSSQHCRYYCLEGSLL